MIRNDSNDKREFVLSKKLLKSATSIGANIAEANGAISKADFSSKIAISYKKWLETKYWLSLLKDPNFNDDTTLKSMHEDADELAKSYLQSSKKTRINK